MQWLPVSVPVLPCPRWLWRGQCELREEWSCCRAPAAAKEKVTGGGEGGDRPGGPGESPQESSSACRAAGHRVGAGRQELLGGSLASRVRVGGEERWGCGAASEPPAGATRSLAAALGARGATGCTGGRGAVSPPAPADGKVPFAACWEL